MCDYRFQIFAFLKDWSGFTSRNHRRRSQGSSSSVNGGESVEIQARTREPEMELRILPTSIAMGTTESNPVDQVDGLRQRMAPGQPVGLPGEEEQYSHIATPSPWLAAGFGALTILTVVVIVLVRAKLQDPPRELEFFTNMLIAGSIIFGVSYLTQRGFVEL
jgi:hypothetical protein